MGKFVSAPEDVKVVRRKENLSLQFGCGNHPWNLVEICA
jgi:hypothetical protein